MTHLFMNKLELELLICKLSDRTGAFRAVIIPVFSLSPALVFLCKPFIIRLCNYFDPFDRYTFFYPGNMKVFLHGGISFTLDTLNI